MKKLKAAFVTGTLAAAALAAAPASAATYIYVGEWFVGDGPQWNTNPEVMSAQEAAAFLFGGIASDYAISTIGSDPNDINFMAHVDGWGDAQYLTNTVAQDFSLDSGAPGYNDPYGGPSYSAYVLDHSCSNRYNNPEQACITNAIGKNYAFRVVGGVPEPMTWMMLILGFLGIGGMMRRKNAAARPSTLRVTYS